MDTDEKGTNWMEDILLNKKFREKFESGEIQAMRYKGTVETFDDLPKTGNVAGDFWNVKDTGKNFAWNGKEWDDVSGIMEVPEATTTVSGTIKLGTTTTVSDQAGMIGKTSNGSAAVQFATNSLAGVVKLSSSKTGLNTTNAAAIGRNGSYQVFVPVATTSDNGSVKLATAITDAGAQSVPTASVVNAALAKKADLERLGNYVPLAGGNIEGDLRVGYVRNGTFYQAVGLNHQTGSADFSGILTAQIGDFANLRVFDRNESGAKVPVFTANPSGVSTSLNISTTGTLTAGSVETGAVNFTGDVGNITAMDDGSLAIVGKTINIAATGEGRFINIRSSVLNFTGGSIWMAHAGSNKTTKVYAGSIELYTENSAASQIYVKIGDGNITATGTLTVGGVDVGATLAELTNGSTIVKSGGKLVFLDEAGEEKETISCADNGDLRVKTSNKSIYNDLVGESIITKALLDEYDNRNYNFVGGRIANACLQLEGADAALDAKITALEARIAALEGASA